MYSHRPRAALDVTDPEPLPPDHPLWGAPGLFLTPHVAGTGQPQHDPCLRRGRHPDRAVPHGPASGQPRSLSARGDRAPRVGAAQRLSS
ncbi:NAD(P)-dependent oxidoreductase [Nocardia nova]|uniref:NAD(P)-dependent oxidoreductase n=1 Tax=Nocardia nova TaxID=37330 RepID=UPI001CA4EC36